LHVPAGDVSCVASNDTQERGDDARREGPEDPGRPPVTFTLWQGRPLWPLPHDPVERTRGDGPADKDVSFTRGPEFGRVINVPQGNDQAPGVFGRRASGG